MPADNSQIKQGKTHNNNYEYYRYSKILLPHRRRKIRDDDRNNYKHYRRQGVCFLSDNDFFAKNKNAQANENRGEYQKREVVISKRCDCQIAF